MEKRDELTEYLVNGWVISGYSVSSAGSEVIHSVLLQKDSELKAIDVVSLGNEVRGRRVIQLAPATPPEKFSYRDAL